jgi:hypothetical protein
MQRQNSSYVDFQSLSFNILLSLFCILQLSLVLKIIIEDIQIQFLQIAYILNMLLKILPIL